MPTYDYLCTECKLQFEARHPINVPNPNCLGCGCATEKIILSAPAAHGKMARGRDLAMLSLQPKPNQVKHIHKPECGCGRTQYS